MKSPIELLQERLAVMLNEKKRIEAVENTSADLSERNLFKSMKARDLDLISAGISNYATAINTLKLA